jgi:tetratricopeptide (TPR) repeat protein
VPLLQAAKQKTLSNQPDSSQAVDALKEHLNSNSAFQIFYTQLTSRRADERKQEKEKLLLTVKNAEKSITDYIRANLNDPNLNQYLDALKVIGVANSDTSSDELKIILNKLSALNPSYAQLQSSNGNTSEQKSSAQIQIILPTNTKLSNDDFNSIFPSGIYAKTEKDCARYLANPKQMLMNERFERVTIQGKEISRYSTGGCTVRNITGADPAYIVSADCTEEGETSNQKYSFSIRNGKFNFGQFDEMGKNWWSFCSPIKPSANNATPQSLLPNKNIFENLDQTKFDNTSSDINKPQIGIPSNSICNEQNLRLQMDIYKRISSKKICCAVLK